jgi:predicted phosphoribosyltransferase
MFRNREDAARQLADLIRPLELKHPLVLAIPRGGLVTGAIVAAELGGELDVVLARKLRSPDQADLAYGAITEDGEVYIDEEFAEASGVNDVYFHREKEHQLQIARTRRDLLRRIRPKAEIRGRPVILVDDGITTGATFIAALKAIRAQEPVQLIGAIPVAPEKWVRDLRKHCDRLYVLNPAKHFWSVGQFYEDYSPIDDDQAVYIFKQSVRKTEQEKRPA